MDTDKRIESIRKTMSLSRGQGTQELGTWFLGPKGESGDLLRSMIDEALKHAVDGRKSTFPNDPPWADPNDPAYKAESNVIHDNFTQLVRKLEMYSIPFSSYRYQGHMLWDQSLPAVAGYFAAMLYNQNNVAAEASPLTTALEIEVAHDLCHMVGYGHEKDIDPWGHITCDGSMANIEALWAGRNSRLYPLGVCAALKKEGQLKKIRDIEVKVTGSGKSRKLIDLDWWELINLRSEVIFDLPTHLSNEAASHGIDSDTLDALLQNYTVQSLGMMAFSLQTDEILGAKRELTRGLSRLKVLGPGSAHYSLPKANTLLGLGTDSFVKIKVQRNARMNTADLKEHLNRHLEQQIPVMTVVAVMGTTEESAVDNLTEILEFREEFRSRGMDFFIHADGAWGGYFASLLNEPGQHSPARHHLEEHKLQLESAKAKMNLKGEKASDFLHANLALKQLTDQGEKDDRSHEKFVYTDRTGLNAHTAKQLARLKDADSITVDPHKSGFTLYPSGSLLYRDHRMPEMIQITAPVVYHNGDAPTVGVFGVEGSKPGAAAAGVYFSHRIIRPDQSGYGRVLGRCTFNAKRVFSQFMAIDSDDFKIAALTDLDEEELKVVRSWSKLSNLELWERLCNKPEEFELFRRTGPDLNIISYALNPIIHKKVNTDPKVTNDFNDKLFKILNSQNIEQPIPEVIVTSSVLDSENSEDPISFLREQLGVKQNATMDMNFLITTVMDPWLSDADHGKRNMIPEVIGYLQTAAENLVHELYYKTEK